LNLGAAKKRFEVLGSINPALICTELDFVVAFEEFPQGRIFEA
jgi:hypothetical protein